MGRPCQGRQEDGPDFPVAGHGVFDELSDVVEDPAPSLTALTMVAVVVQQDRSWAPLETSVPVMPMAMPMLARFRAGVVDAVAGHRYKLFCVAES